MRMWRIGGGGGAGGGASSLVLMCHDHRSQPLTILHILLHLSANPHEPSQTAMHSDPYFTL